MAGEILNESIPLKALLIPPGIIIYMLLQDKNSPFKSNELVPKQNKHNYLFISHGGVINTPVKSYPCCKIKSSKPPYENISIF